MGKQSNKKKHRLKVRTHPWQTKRRGIDMKPEELAVYVRQAEQKALPVMKEVEVSAGAALFLLAQYAQALLTGNPGLTLESATSITNSVLALWETGSYQPGPQYPFTLEETRLDLQHGRPSPPDYSADFQAFLPVNPSPPVGLGQVAGGIVHHPKTHLWQIWMMLDGPCQFLGAYYDPATAQNNLEEIIGMARRGGSLEDAECLYKKLLAQGDGQPQQIPFAMMTYLIDHLDMYLIAL